MSGKESSWQREQPVQRSWGGNMPGVFRAQQEELLLGVSKRASGRRGEVREVTGALVAV